MSNLLFSFLQERKKNLCGHRFGTNESFVLEILLYKYRAKTVYTINKRKGLFDYTKMDGLLLGRQEFCTQDFLPGGSVSPEMDSSAFWFRYFSQENS